MSTSVDDLKNKGHKAVDDAADTANGVLGGASPLLKKAADQAFDMAADLSDNIVSYTKSNPAKALGVAAAAGALLYVLIKALTTSRD